MTTTWYRSFFFNICYSSNNSIKLLTAFERQRFNTFDTHLGHLDILLGIELLFSAFEPLSSFKLFMSETVMCRSLRHIVYIIFWRIPFRDYIFCLVQNIYMCICLRILLGTFNFKLFILFIKLDSKFNTVICSVTTTEYRFEKFLFWL